MTVPKLPGAYWQESWREQQERKVRLDPEREMIGPVGYFNPYCKHERSSYDILTCDACIAHTKHLLALRAGAAEAENDTKEIT